MKQFLISFLLLLLHVSFLAAQQLTPMTDLTKFEQRLKEEAQHIQSIESEFVQHKYLDIFDEIVTSKGKFYYGKSNKICMEYFRPLDYLIVINDVRLKIVADGKKNVMNLSSNKMMNEMQDLLTACMVGDLSKISSGYSLDYFENKDHYFIQIQPNNKSVKAYLDNIEIYIDKKDMSVSKLKLSENEADYTQYEFYNKKFNSLSDESKFNID